MVANQKTKRNQGDQLSSSAILMYNNHHIIPSQPGSRTCPFKHCMDNLHPDVEYFFQRPSRNLRIFDKMPLGKNTLGELMKTISKEAKLSKVDTNQQIHKTTATGLAKKGHSLQEISHVTKHKNIQSLQHYIAQSDYEDKEICQIFVRLHQKR